MDGFYSHEYFELLQNLKLRYVEVADLKKALTCLSESADKNKRLFCSIL